MNVQDNNFCVPQGWMLKLGLQSAQELIAYALVYSFSQDGESEFKGSLTYLEGWLMCSRPTAIKIMQNLVDRGLLYKRQEIISGVTCNRYKAIVPENFTTSKDILLPSKDVLLGGSKAALPNNKCIINNSNTIPPNACAKDVFFEWVRTSDMPEFIQRTFMRFGIPIDTDIDPYMHAFLDNSIQDRELTARNERYAVLKHFENWLPRYIEAKKKEYDNARNQSAQRGREESIQERPPVYPT